MAAKQAHPFDDPALNLAAEIVEHLVDRSELHEEDFWGEVQGVAGMLERFTDAAVARAREEEREAIGAKITALYLEYKKFPDQKVAEIAHNALDEVDCFIRARGGAPKEEA